ncbi:MAG: glycosyltransferase involved in cell wall biosynthesis [Kiritimatiellia bacterium]|jgi:polyisoprenyl-phosphate glycosyltransferase
MISIITPAWKEAENLPVLYDRLVAVLEGQEWEWVIVDDHSPDGTFAAIYALSQKDPRVRGIRLSRNSGSHVALTAGINQALGACGIMIAADLQDPPETIPQLLEEWEQGNQVVWAVRAAREGESATTIGFSRLYYWIMRRLVGMKEMPATGADFLLMDRKVIEAFNRFNESNVSILSLITWMGFKQTRILYTKEARLHGETGWTFAKKFKLVIDSVTSFTYLPIRMMSVLGFSVAFIGFLYALYLLYAKLAGSQIITGFATTMIVILVLGGLQMMMMGVLGEYLWRSLDEARRRPRYMIEENTQD